jgi:uncharacterized membrane protein YbhN (UPF0104 family)
MDRDRINRVLRGFGTIAAFSLLVFLISQQGWEEIMDGLLSIPTWRFWVAVGLMFVSRLAVTARWHTLMRAAGVSLRVRDSLRITFSGLFASNFLPTTIGGDVVRLAMAMRQGFDKVISTASLVVDRLVGMVGMATAAPIGLIPLLNTASTATGPPMISSGVLVGLSGRVRGILRQLWEAIQIWLRSPRGLLIAFAWTWVHQICIYFVVWLILDGMGEDISFWLTGGLWSFTYFVTLLPVSINGLGLQELSMTAIYTGIGGVSVPSAATAALLFRTIQMVASFPGAAFLPDILQGRKQSHRSEPGG